MKLKLSSIQMTYVSVSPNLYRFALTKKVSFNVIFYSHHTYIFVHEHQNQNI